MEKSEALRWLELDELASNQEIESAYRKLYNEYQIRITNAPTASQRSKFQEKLVELDKAYEVLKGDSSENIQSELPSLHQVEHKKTTAPQNLSTRNISKQEALQIIAVKEPFSTIELDSSYQQKKLQLEASIQNAFNDEIRNAYHQSLQELNQAYSLLSKSPSQVISEKKIVAPKTAKKRTGSAFNWKLIAGIAGGLIILIVAFIWLTGSTDTHAIAVSEDIEGLDNHLTIYIKDTTAFACEKEQEIVIDLPGVSMNSLLVEGYGAKVRVEDGRFFVTRKCEDSVLTSYLFVSYINEGFDDIVIAEIDLQQNFSDRIIEADLNDIIEINRGQYIAYDVLKSSEDELNELIELPDSLLKLFNLYSEFSDNGNVIAKYNLGIMYRNGIHVNQDHERAVEYYRSAAEAGYAPAQNNLGYSYLSSKRGVKKDYAVAVDWFRKAASQGNRTAQYNLARSYDKGRGVSESEDQAIYWYERAAKQGHRIAQYKLGVIHAEEDGENYNLSKALIWLKLSALRHYDFACARLGVIYELGKGVPADGKEAFIWYLRGAVLGESLSMIYTAEMYEKGSGGILDIEKANYWYKKACDEGEKDACDKATASHNNSSPSNSASSTTTYHATSTKGNWTDEDIQKAYRELNKIRGDIESEIGNQTDAFFRCFVNKIENTYSNFTEADSDEQGCTRLATQCRNEL